MRKLEAAPHWFDGELPKRAMEIRLNPEIESIVSRLNDKYLYWDKVKYYKTEVIDDPALLWATVKLSRVVNAKKIHFGKYTFYYNLTDYIQRCLHDFDLHIGGHLGAGGLIPAEDKKRYLVSSIMEEAIASSQIEGAVTTRKTAKEMLRKNIKPRNKSEQMIVNNYNTIREIVETKDGDISREKILLIHKLMTTDTLDHPEDEGRYREDNEINIVDSIDGEVVHTPPDYREIEELMNQLILFMNHDSEDQFIHPIIKGCIIHFMIGYVHPFVDGNGRTARALFYWYLLKKGYWLTEYLSISRLIMKSKTQYAMAYLYSETDENDLSYFITYKFKTMQLAFASLQEYIHRKIAEKRQVINFRKMRGINERQALIIKWLYEEPELLFSVKEIENRLNVSNQTARTDLSELVAKGYLEILDLNKKTKGFCRSADFARLLEAELPEQGLH